MYKTFSMELAGRTLSVDVGRVAAQANGAAFMHYGETTVLSTATASEKPREGIDFFPLSVEFEEKLYAVGKIPGGFNKREGKASENSVLTSRVIDRPMRPLFPKDYRNDVTLNNLVLSVDPECRPELVAMIGSAIATCISDIPFAGPCAMTQVGMIDGEFIINPSQEQWKKGDLQLTVASTSEKVIMIEAGANEVPEAVMIDAIYKAHDVNQTLIEFINKIVAEVGKPKHSYTSCAVPQELFDAMKEIVPPEEMEQAVFTDVKQVREENIRQITARLEEAFADREEWLAVLGEAVYQYQKKTVRDIDVKGKKVLLRCDFNVPQDKKTGAITSDKRIVAALPTIRYLLDQGAAVIACSHLGKPQPDFDKWVKKQTEKGKDPAELTEAAWSKEQKKLTLAPVAARLAELLGQEVIFASDVVGEDAQAKAAALQPGQVLLLENTRFEKGETKNDPAFAQKLASMAEVYVSDAFGAVHRAHASTAGVAAYLPAVSGFLIEKELEVIGGALANPKRPLVAILGGSKVSSKIGVINNLLEIADTIIIGGGMAYTFSAAQGGQVGDSLLEADWEAYSLEMLEKAKAKGVKLLLPVDTVIADAFSPDANSKVVKSGEIPAGWQGLDIGPETVKLYCDAVADAGTVIWNGPMGVFEFPAFAVGTKAVAEALSKTSAITIIGGGDSAAAVEQLGYADKMTHISTGGGASLEFMEGKELPGVACLLDK